MAINKIKTSMSVNEDPRKTFTFTDQISASSC